MTDEKVYENKMRRAAARQGYRLTKSRRRDPRAVDFGKYWLIDPDMNGLVAGDQFGWTLEEIEQYLSGETGMRK